MPLSNPQITNLKPRLRAPSCSSWIIHSAKASEPQKLRGQVSGTFRREIGQDFSDDARELEAVAAEAAGDGDSVVGGVAVDDEVVVGAVGVEAGAEGQERAVGVGQKTGEGGADG